MAVRKFADAAGITELWSKVKSYISSAISGKQDILVSGTNIKTVNNISLLGSGNIPISSGGVIVSSTAPTGNSSILWIDIGNNGVAKYWDGSSWTPINANVTWG